VADYETLGRFLAAEIARKNDAGGLLADGGLKASLTEELVKESRISQLNAERLVAVLGEQLTAGTLAVDAGKLKVADGRSWYLFFDDLIRREQLVSEDTEGWMIEKDLLQDLIQDPNGDRYLRVEVACINDQMYLGMARPDLFIRKADQPFWVGYWKAILSILLMLLLIIVLGVTVSCVVKGPVALLFTLTFFIVGQFFHDFMIRHSGVDDPDCPAPQSRGGHGRIVSDDECGASGGPGSGRRVAWIQHDCAGLCGVQPCFDVCGEPV
jgi:hypothetical protein